MTEFDFREPPENFFSAPENRVVAQMEAPEAVAAAIDELAEAGFDRDELWVLCGAQGTDRLDITGRHHGLKGRIYRIVEAAIGEEGTYLPGINKHLAEGGLVIAVPAKHESTETAARILHSHGAHDVLHIGRGHWERLGR